MKRWIFSFLSFPLAFVFAWLAVALFGYADESKYDCPVQIPMESQIAEISEGKSFSAEFQELPNDEDVEYPEFNTHLLDISNGSDIFSTPEDVPAKSGDRWLTLSRTRSGTFVVEESKISVRKYSSKEMGDGLLKVRFLASSKPILAVRKLASIRPGDVQNLHFDPTGEDETDEAESMGESFRREFKLNSVTYVLRVSRGITKAGQEIDVLVLTDGVREQVIDRSPIWPGSRPNLGHLIWAGDLDQDGKLDLYIDRSLGEEKAGTGLFLSSHTKKGQLVKLAALFGHTGC